MTTKTVKVKGMKSLKSSSIKRRSMPKGSEDSVYLKKFILAKEKETITTMLHALNEKRDKFIERLNEINKELKEKTLSEMEIEADEKEPAMDVDNKGKEFKKMKLNY